MTGKIHAVVLVAAFALGAARANERTVSSLANLEAAVRDASAGLVMVADGEYATG